MAKLAPVICEECGKVFQAGPYAYFCPECRRAKLSRDAKERSLNKLGNAAYSEQRAAAKREAGK